MNRLNDEETLALANLLTKKLVFDLDAGDLSSVDTVGILLSDLPVDIFFTAIRIQIGVDRIVKNNLDENKIWRSLIHLGRKFCEDNSYSYCSQGSSK